MEGANHPVQAGMIDPSTALPAAGRAVAYSRDAFGTPVTFMVGQRAFHLDVEGSGMALA